MPSTTSNIIPSPAYAPSPTGGAFTIQIGEDSEGHDFKWLGDTSGAYMMWDESADQLVFDLADIQLGDTDYLKFGDATGGDVSMAWDGTNLVVLPAADDTGIFEIGNGTKDMDFRVTLGAATDYVEADVGNKALEIVGDVRIDLSSATVAAANTDGGVLKAGASDARVTEDTADMKFISLYFDDGATSGDARGIYDRLYITGAGGGGEALRVFTTVEDVAGASAHGAHISLNFGTSGSVTGQGNALRATLHMPSTALGASNVTYSAINAEVYSDGATSDPSGNLLSIFQIGNSGNGSGADTGGAADVDDDCALFDFRGWTVGAGNMIGAVGNEPTWDSKTHKIRCRLPDGTAAYLVAVID